MGKVKWAPGSFTYRTKHWHKANRFTSAGMTLGRTCPHTEGKHKPTLEWFYHQSKAMIVAIRKGVHSDYYVWNLSRNCVVYTDTLLTRRTTLCKKEKDISAGLPGQA